MQRLCPTLKSRHLQQCIAYRVEPEIFRCSAVGHQPTPIASMSYHQLVPLLGRKMRHVQALQYLTNEESDALLPSFGFLTRFVQTIRELFVTCKRTGSSMCSHEICQSPKNPRRLRTIHLGGVSFAASPSSGRRLPEDANASSFRWARTFV